MAAANLGPVKCVRISQTPTDPSSKCNLAEFEVWGSIYSNQAVTLASQSVDAVLYDGIMPV